MRHNFTIKQPINYFTINAKAPKTVTYEYDNFLLLVILV